MENRYCNREEVIKKLIKKWQRYANLIVAVDFDDTIKAYSEEDSCTRVLPLLKQCQDLNFILILFTCNEGDRLKQAVDYCKEQGITFTYINENPLVPYISGRKPFYDILLDDKAALGPACDMLEEAITQIKQLL